MPNKKDLLSLLSTFSTEQIWQLIDCVDYISPSVNFSEEELEKFKDAVRKKLGDCME